MQSVFPAAPNELGYDDLVELYTYPSDETWVRASFVSTIDGAAQGEDLKSGSLSSAPDRELFQLLRSLCDVILVGATTTRIEAYAPVQADEVDSPLRAALGLAPVPAIAVVSRSLRLDPALLAGGEAPTIVLTSEAASPDDIAALREHVPVIVAGRDIIDLPAAVDALAGRGYRRVLCEGGPRIMRDLTASGRLDELCVTINPLLLAGDRLRITCGAPIGGAPPLRLRHVLESDGALFCRYTSR